MTGLGFAPSHPLVRISRSFQEALQAPRELDAGGPSLQQSSDPMRRSEVLAHDLVAVSVLTPSRTG